MKKENRILLGILAVVFGLAALIVWSKYRGALPAILPPLPRVSPPSELSPSSNTTGMPLSLPPGFSISIFASDLPGARVMSYDPVGNLVVSLMSEGRVVALVDKNQDGRIWSSEIETVISGLNRPHGIAWRCRDTCKLYIAEENQVATYEYNSETHKATGKKKIIDLPVGEGHFTRTLMFLPAPEEDKLLISIGSSCNVCNEEDSRRAKILVANYDGSDLKEYASGLRNAVFMAIHPVNGTTWVTEMGRDNLGDDLPPDEINIIPPPSSWIARLEVNPKFDYGWPICYGKNIHDGDFDKNVYVRDPCEDKEPSYIDIPAHSAPLGLAFIPEEGWPEDWWYDAIVAYHGSWDRSEPTGYKLVRMKLDAQGKYEGVEDFITGWLSGSRIYGRPVDVLTQPGGTIFVSDDSAGLIYKIIYRSTVEDVLAEKSNLIRVTFPEPSVVVTSPLVVIGEALGNWYFEASFPVRLLDSEGNEIAITPAQAQRDWMTTEFVPFEATLQFRPPPAGTCGILVLEKDNPSGLPEYTDELRFPVCF